MCLSRKEFRHQLTLPWGTRHLISPELAGKDVMILLHHLLLYVGPVRRSACKGTNALHYLTEKSCEDSWLLCTFVQDESAQGECMSGNGQASRGGTPPVQ